MAWLCSTVQVYEGGAVSQGDRDPGEYARFVGPDTGRKPALLEPPQERVTDYSWQVVLPPSRFQLVDIDALTAFADRVEIVETPDHRHAAVARICVDQTDATEPHWREWRRLLWPALVPRVVENRRMSWPKAHHLVDEDWCQASPEEIQDALTAHLRRPKRT